jgi:hypothetical protein
MSMGCKVLKADVYRPDWNIIKGFNRRQEVEGLQACWRRFVNSWG